MMKSTASIKDARAWAEDREMALGLIGEHLHAIARGVDAKHGDEIHFAARFVLADRFAGVADDAFGVEQIVTI
jgi:hypothetical protein